MLIITRKPNESLTVDGPAEIVFIDVTKRRARIGISAPSTTNIVRTELLSPAAVSETLPTFHATINAFCPCGLVIRVTTSTAIDELAKLVLFQCPCGRTILDDLPGFVERTRPDVIADMHRRFRRN